MGSELINSQLNFQTNLSGWGRVNKPEDKCPGWDWNCLRYIQVPLMTNTICDLLFHDYLISIGNYTLDNISPNMVCAGFPGAGKNACSGDSGGPLVVPKSPYDNTAVIFGIASWVMGDDCSSVSKIG